MKFCYWMHRKVFYNLKLMHIFSSYIYFFIWEIKDYIQYVLNHNKANNLILPFMRYLVSCFKTSSTGRRIKFSVSFLAQWIEDILIWNRYLRKKHSFAKLCLFFYFKKMLLFGKILISKFFSSYIEISIF